MAKRVRVTPTRRDEFDEDTRYERHVMDVLFDAMASFEGREVQGSRVDLRKPGAVIVEASGGISLRRDPRPDMVALLRPLVAGAAFKTIDHVVELAKEVRCGPSGRLFFTAKIRFVGASEFALPPPLDGDSAMAQRVARLYVALQDVRHSVVHRRVGHHPDGTVVPYDEGGGSLSPVTPQELDALVHLASGIAAAVVNGTVDERQSNALRWHLDQLARLHRLGSLNAERHQATPRPILALLNVEGGRLFPDVEAVSSYVAKAAPSSFTPVTFRSEEGFSVTTTLRVLPDATEGFLPDSPPAWVDRVTFPHEG